MNHTESWKDKPRTEGLARPPPAGAQEPALKSPALGNLDGVNARANGEMAPSAGRILFLHRL